MANDDAGIAAVVARLPPRRPSVMVLEATGGDQRAVVAALAAARLRVAVGNPRHGRACAQATGQRAQTEALDARALAPVAAAVRPPPRPLPDAPADARRARRARRRPLVPRRTAEQNRLGRAPPRRQTDIQAPIPWRTERRARLDDDLDTRRRARPVWRAREALWRRVPGRGPVGPRRLRLARPEWGPWSRQRRAALVGVAPVHRERGPRRGRRMIWGGRVPVRAPLSLSPLGAVRSKAVRKGCSERWRAAGPAATVALAAGMRKRWTILQARVNHHPPWPPQEVLGA